MSSKENMSEKYIVITDEQYRRGYLASDERGYCTGHKAYKLETRVHGGKYLVVNPDYVPSLKKGGDL